MIIVAGAVASSTAIQQNKNKTMTMISKSDKHNPNYLAKVIRIQNLRKLPKADRLLVFNVDGNEIITSNETKEGTIGVYFPLECQIDAEYLSKTNSFTSKSLNLDPEKKGYFSDTGRVKATRLRGQPSMGYVVPVSTFDYMLNEKELEELASKVGEEFDTLKGVLLVKKYVVVRQQGLGGGDGKPKQGRSPKVSKLIDKQFRLHYDTSQLGKNMHRIQPEDVISITWKLHGTSWVSSKILCKRPLTWLERLAKKLGVKVNDTEYSNVYSSRKVIKNSDINKNPQHYYGTDIWGDINNIFKDQLKTGESLYGEAVGFTKDGGAIQKGFDYKCGPNEFKVYIYRVTQTGIDGNVIDLPFNMVQERAAQLGVEAVPYIYFGRADRFLPYEDFENVEQWQDALREILAIRYVKDQDSQFCNNIVPEEGIVVRKEGHLAEAFKYKAFRFLEGETASLDAGEVSVEDEGSEDEESESED